ncbi:insulinase family protein [Pedobacter nototheniae]|uniref:insulinase family protein n=1 Tax=Pedobacter nototheniae TaxID=2488994 RepID=UPI00292D1654|nr:insulinase family protein [Pedobacter nototheniae]
MIKRILFTTLITLTLYTGFAQNRFKEPVSYKLKNGMNIIISENDNSEQAYSSFTLDKNAFKNKKDGIVELLNAVLNEGLEKNRGISFRDNSGALSVSKTDFENSLQVMAKIIINTNLTKNTFDIAKAKLLMSLKTQDYDYDETVTAKSIAALSLMDVQEFYNQITPNRTYLTLAGNINTDEAKTAAKKAFGNWNKEIKKTVTIMETK